MILLLSLLSSDIAFATGVRIDSSSLGFSSIVSSEDVNGIRDGEDLPKTPLPGESWNDRLAWEDNGESGGCVMDKFLPDLVLILLPVLELIVSVLKERDSVR